MGGCCCCCANRSFDALRSSEACLLQPIARQLEGKGVILSRDFLVKVADDPVVTHGIIHCLELRPSSHALFQEDAAMDVRACGCRVAAEGWQAADGPKSAAADGQRAVSESPPLVLLPGFGMGAASFAACIEHLLNFFPERRVFLVDWPASGAAPRMPWTHTANSRFMQRAPPRGAQAGASPASLLHQGVVHVSGEPRGKECPYPLPEQRFIAMIEGWRQHLGIPKMILVGHSIGGYIAFNYAEKYPGCIHHLILCSPCGVPLRPDACGMSEESYRSWKARNAQEDPASASEFSKGLPVKRPRITWCDCFCLCISCPFCLVMSPLMCLVALCIRVCGRPRSSSKLTDLHPQNGVPYDFMCDWTPMSNLDAADHERLYKERAVPPTARLRWLISLLGTRSMQLFAELRFADNGQWAESTAPAPSGSPCDIVSGHTGVSSTSTGSQAAGGVVCGKFPDGGTTSGRHLLDSAAAQVKVHRSAFGDYQFHISTFGELDFNWGEQLFGAVQCSWGYSSYGWSRRPIGRRLEQLLGLPRNFEGCSEYYCLDRSKRYRDDASLEIEDGEDDESLAPNVPVSFFYGKSDWMPFQAARLISEKVARHSGKAVPVLQLKHAGHQMFIDNPKGFVQGLRLLVPPLVG
mmetsp:Transcript_28806/g.82490  ORF Transcript_28806/g.82490 Transcript_28806/m.82490 type:complete len:636 (+) Transcript_28806:157-2064(+)